MGSVTMSLSSVVFELGMPSNVNGLHITTFIKVGLNSCNMRLSSFEGREDEEEEPSSSKFENPWGVARSSSSACSLTYQLPADDPLYSVPARTPSPSSPSPSHHYDVIEGPRLNRATGGTPRAVTPSEAAVQPCGGHCTACENFCHYCLQVLFIAGILTGISLVVAGSILRGHKRGGDLLVLVYIGCLTALVCALLLSVQCCVRRNVQRRRKTRRDCVAMQDLGPVQAPALPGQYEPLLRHLVHQQIADQRREFVDSVVRGEHSGIPWWRRQSQPQSQPQPSVSHHPMAMACPPHHIHRPTRIP